VSTVCALWRTTALVFERFCARAHCYRGPCNDDIRHANFRAASSEDDGDWQLTSAAPHHVVGTHKNYCYLMVGDDPDSGPAL
jgi:hypothetical protein